MEKSHIKARRKSRKIAMQALYQWMMTSMELSQIKVQFHMDNDLSKIDVEYFDELIFKIPSNLEAIDDSFEEFLDRKISDLNPVELSIIRLACYELLYRLDIPYKVVVNEAINLAKEFGAQEGYKFVNGILDNVAQKVRVDEFN